MKKTLLVTCTTLLIVGCTQATPSVNESESQLDQKISVTTSFYPLTHFAKQVGEELIDVQQISAQGSDPHTYEPTAKQVKNIYESDLLIFNGEGQDEWAVRIHEELERSGVRTLIATEVAKLMPYEEEEEHHDDHDDHHEGHEEHDDHEEHDHEHGEWDPHVWLDPVRVQEIVEAIARELSEIDPAHAAEFKSNAKAYITQLRTLDNEIRAGLNNCNLDAVIVSHDAFRYLANRYDFRTLEIAGLSPNAEPSPSRLAELSAIAEEEGIKYVFFETHVSPALSNTLAEEIGADTLVLHSIEALTQEERSAEKTYVSIMQENLANLRTALDCR